MEAVTAIRVRLVDWHDSSKSAEVVASTLQQLRSMVEDTTKLYFYDVRNGRVRGTERVKLVGDSEFTVLKQQPADARPVTVYYYARRDGEEDPDSPPRGVLQECFRYQIRQRPLRRSDKTTDTQSVRKGCAIAARVPAWWNLDLMNPYRDPHGSTIPAFSLLPLFSWYGCAGVGKCQTVTELPPTCRFELRKSGWC